MTAREAFELSTAAVRRRFHRWEMGVDGAVQGIAIVAGLIGAVALLMIAARHGVPVGDIAAVVIYSVGLLTMLGCSLAYSLGRFTRHRDWLQRLDHSAIFLMIAGTYTPFTVIDLTGAWSWGFTSVIWTVSMAGVLLRLAHQPLFDRISLGLYLALGWIGIVALPSLIGAVDTPALVLLAAGGALYTIGIAFHLWERLPFQRVIWHGFVIAAAAMHFAAVVISVSGGGSPA